MALKCVCERACQVRNSDGKIIYYKKGQVGYFKECPPNFRPIAGPKRELVDDLAKASREELLEGDYTIKQLREYAQEKFDVKLKGKTKEDVVDSFLDAKYRYLGESDLNRLM